MLFLLSDGVPDTGTESSVTDLIAQLKRDSVVAVSCFVTNSDSIEPRRLRAEPLPSWPDGARLMFDCASLVEAGTPLAAYLADQGWRQDRGGRLFAQVNRSDILTEFMAATIRPALRRSVEVFVSYAHEDEELRRRLDSHLAMLRRQGVIGVWSDRRLVAGQRWDTEIDRRIESADLVLLLVSAAFLDPDYCYSTEMARALQRCQDGQAVVIPHAGRLDGCPLPAPPDPA